MVQLYFNNSILGQNGRKEPPLLKLARFEAGKDFALTMDGGQSRRTPFLTPELESNFYSNRHGMLQVVDVLFELWCRDLSWSFDRKEASPIYYPCRASRPR